MVRVHERIPFNEKNVFRKRITLYQVYMFKMLRSHILRHTVGILYIRYHYPPISFLMTLLKSLTLLTISVQSGE